MDFTWSEPSMSFGSYVDDPLAVWVISWLNKPRPQLHVAVGGIFIDQRRKAKQKAGNKKQQRCLTSWLNTHHGNRSTRPPTPTSVPPPSLPPMCQPTWLARVLWERSDGRADDTHYRKWNKKMLDMLDTLKATQLERTRTETSGWEPLNTTPPHPPPQPPDV